MEQTNQRLRAALLGAVEKKSAARILRPILDDIEEALRQGATYEQLRKVLDEQGFGEISEHNFRITLYRLRKERGSARSDGESSAVSVLRAKREAQPALNPAESSGDLNGEGGEKGPRMPIIAARKKKKFNWIEHRDAPVKW